MKSWTQVVRFVTSTVHPRESVLENEQEQNKNLESNQEQDNDQGLVVVS